MVSNSRVTLAEVKKYSENKEVSKKEIDNCHSARMVYKMVVLEISRKFPRKHSW